MTIVADISPATVNKDGGAATMRTILLAHPTVDVVLGADTVVLGALAALREAGKARPDQFLGGIDGEPEAVAEIKKGDVPTRRASALPRRSSAMRWASTPLTGSKASSIPQAMDILPIALTLAQHRPLRGRCRRSRRGLCRSGAARAVSEDVRQHLLRHARPVSSIFRGRRSGSDGSLGGAPAC